MRSRNSELNEKVKAIIKLCVVGVCKLNYVVRKTKSNSTRKGKAPFLKIKLFINVGSLIFQKIIPFHATYVQPGYY